MRWARDGFVASKASSRPRCGIFWSCFSFALHGWLEGIFLGLWVTLGTGHLFFSFKTRRERSKGLLGHDTPMGRSSQGNKTLWYFSSYITKCHFALSLAYDNCG